MEIKDIISNVEVTGLERAIRASKMAMAVDVDKLDGKPTATTKILAGSGMGEGHDCFLKGIVVQFDLTFTIKAWTEAERYHWLEIVTSQSTMHRISKMQIEPNCIEYVDRRIIKVVEELSRVYNALVNAGNATEDDFLRLVYSVPVGFKLTAAMVTNYRQLKTIYFQRRHHRLPEWKALCEWIESLPMFKELVLGLE